MLDLAWISGNRVCIKNFFDPLVILPETWALTTVMHPFSLRRILHVVHRFRTVPNSLVQDERGFALIEAIVGVAIVSIAIGGLITAVLVTLRPLADARWNGRLTSIAENVLSDLRAATAYDTSTVAPAVGSVSSFDVHEPNADGVRSTYHVDVTFTRTPPAPVSAIVSVRDDAGHVVRLDDFLTLEAPHPGATLSPEPSQNIATAPPIEIVPETPPTTPPVDDGSQHGPDTDGGGD